MNFWILGLQSLQSSTLLVFLRNRWVGLGVMVVLLLLMNLPELQIPVMWQIKCFVCTVEPGPIIVIADIFPSFYLRRGH